MTSKRELLLEICQTPGYQPPDSSQAQQWVDELQEEGWITTRLDGYAATPLALDAYPNFLQAATGNVIAAVGGEPAVAVAPAHDESEAIGLFVFLGRGYEIVQDEHGRYETYFLDPRGAGSRPTRHRVGGHLTSIKLIARFVELMPEMRGE